MFIKAQGDIAADEREPILLHRQNFGWSYNVIEGGGMTPDPLRKGKHYIVFTFKGVDKNLPCMALDLQSKQTT